MKPIHILAVLLFPILSCTSKAESYQKDCSLDISEACVNLGNSYKNGEGVSKDAFRAFRYYEKACSLDHSGGCFNLGYALYYDEGVSEELAQKLSWEKLGVPLQYYKKACSLDIIGTGCSQQLTREPLTLDAVGFELLEMACAYEDAKGCLNLGAAYTLGKGVSKDESKAVESFQKACSLGLGEGCLRTSNAYGNGVGVSKDDSKAFEYLQKACLSSVVGSTHDLEVGKVCRLIGQMYAQGVENGRLSINKDASKAEEYHKKACAFGVSEACKSGSFKQKSVDWKSEFEKREDDYTYASPDFDGFKLTVLNECKEWFGGSASTECLADCAVMAANRYAYNDSHDNPQFVEPQVRTALLEVCIK